MRAGTVGEVVKAVNHPKFKEGDMLSGWGGVQQFTLTDGEGFYKINTELANPKVHMSTLGMPGMTAYFGILEVGKIKSGETFDTKFSLNAANKKGAQTAAIVNVMGSSISRMVDHVIMQGSGPEICVVSTKAALAQAILLLRTALELGFREGYLDLKDFDAHLRDLETFPEMISKLLNEKSGFLRK